MNSELTRLHDEAHAAMPRCVNCGSTGRCVDGRGALKMIPCTPRVTAAVHRGWEPMIVNTCVKCKSTVQVPNHTDYMEPVDPDDPNRRPEFKMICRCGWTWIERR